ncbi:MAG TPA: phosphoribosyltransferase family protein, partial [Chitinophagaceae bacterium]
MSHRKYVLDKEVAAKKLERMAYEIVESNLEEKSLILAGISGNGTAIAQIMRELLGKISTIQIDIVEITLDKRAPGPVTLSPSIDVNGKVVIVVDDVVNSGKTLLYALKPLLDFQPKKIQTLVLVARSYRSFPIRPDYVGLSIS